MFRGVQTDDAPPPRRLTTPQSAVTRHECLVLLLTATPSHMHVQKYPCSLITTHHPQPTTTYNTPQECLDLLLTAHRIPEAAFLARTYLPSHVPRIVEAWKADLAKVHTYILAGCYYMFICIGTCVCICK